MVNPAYDFEEAFRSPLAMSERELDGFRELLYGEAGITLGEKKHSMVAARLSKRLRALRLGSYGEYLELIATPIGRSTEMAAFIDAMTTNKTEFFRERNHFDILVERILPEMAPRLGMGEPFKIWSAGCSSGEEPYSLAMTLYEYFQRNGAAFSVYATDICTEALKRAEVAVYADEAVRTVPPELSRKYLMRGKGRQNGYWRVTPEIRWQVTVEYYNLMSDLVLFDGSFDVIWCRNVMIYFDAPTKTELTKRLCRWLKPGGYLFVGHSESLNGLTDACRAVAPAVYQKPANGGQV